MCPGAQPNIDAVASDSQRLLRAGANEDPVLSKGRLGEEHPLVKGKSQGKCHPHRRRARVPRIIPA